MTASPLAAQIGIRIIEMVRTGEMLPGSHVREHAIATSLQVSRSPVREALRELARCRIVKHHKHRGCFVESASLTSLEQARRRLARTQDNNTYREIAAQRLDGKLAESFTEADIGRQFKLSRVEVRRIVERMVQEGWIERRPGYGWAFVPIITSVTSFDLSYRFRRAVEPAALLEPTFSIDKDAFARCRAEQRALLQGKLEASDPIELFRLGSRFHEMLAKCSGNPLFLDAVQRVNRLRRLLEYRVMVDTQPFRNEAREHLMLLDLIEEAQMTKASRLMARHLDKNRKMKIQILRTSTTIAKERAKKITLGFHF
jgi:DNA-binding GntR family transcriptional regulator